MATEKPRSRGGRHEELRAEARRAVRDLDLEALDAFQARRDGVDFS